MNLKEFEDDVRSTYTKKRSKELKKRVASLFDHIHTEWQLSNESLSQNELKILSETILEHETKTLHDEVQDLLEQRERIERQLERASEKFQGAKYRIFDAIEESLGETSFQTLGKLHQVKLQSIDLLDMLEEMVESAIVTTLEKGHDTEETIEEITKELTFETLSEGPLSTIRIRQVLSTILQAAIEVADATPNKGEEIIRGTMRGIRSGLIKSISNFKKQLIYMPEEARSALVEGYESLHNELQRSDLLFAQMVDSIAEKSSSTSQALLEKISKEIHYDLKELVQISKETVEIMRDRVSSAVQRSSDFSTQTANEAKRMGVQAWASAKTAVNSALNNAKGRIDKK